MNGSYFSLTLIYEKVGVLGLQPQDRTQIQRKLLPPVTECLYMQNVHRVDASIILGLYYA